VRTNSIWNQRRRLVFTAKAPPWRIIRPAPSSIALKIPNVNTTSCCASVRFGGSACQLTSGRSPMANTRYVSLRISLQGQVDCVNDSLNSISFSFRRKGRTGRNRFCLDCSSLRGEMDSGSKGFPGRICHLQFQSIGLAYLRIQHGNSLCAR
jgi:hypothetical protein